jgi:hypothetical protein
VCGAGLLNLALTLCPGNLVSPVFGGQQTDDVRVQLHHCYLLAFHTSFDFLGAANDGSAEEHAFSFRW